MQSSESSRSSGTPETQVLASEGRQSPQVFPCGSRARVFIINAHRTMDRCGSGHECAKPLGAGCLRGRLGQVLALRCTLALAGARIFACSLLTPAPTPPSNFALLTGPRTQARRRGPDAHDSSELLDISGTRCGARDIVIPSMLADASLKKVGTAVCTHTMNLSLTSIVDANVLPRSRL